MNTQPISRDNLFILPEAMISFRQTAGTLKMVMPAEIGTKSRNSTILTAQGSIFLTPRRVLPF
jgi:hypothetical protein